MAVKRRPREPAEQTFDDLLTKHLKPRRYGAVYLLVGEDGFRIDQAVATMRDHVLEPASVAFNFHVYQAEQVGLEGALQQAVSYPMLGVRQLVWLKDVDKALADAKAEQALERYCARPVEATILVLSASKLDGRKRWVKYCRQAGWLFLFSPPKGRHLSSWVRKAASRAGLPFPDPLPDMLIELVGPDLHALTSEIQKLALLAEEQQGQLTADALLDMVMAQRVEEKFGILKRLQVGDPGPALQMLQRQAAWGQGPQEVGPILFWMIRKLALARALQDQKYSSQEIPHLAGLLPWSWHSQIEPISNALGTARVRGALEAAKECEKRMKSSAVPSEILLEQAILRFCGMAGQP